MTRCAKTPYVTRAEAATVLKHGRTQKGLMIYHCPSCAYWHLGRKHKREGFA